MNELFAIPDRRAESPFFCGHCAENGIRFEATRFAVIEGHMDLVHDEDDE